MNRKDILFSILIAAVASIAPELQEVARLWNEEDEYREWAIIPYLIMGILLAAIFLDGE